MAPASYQASTRGDKADKTTYSQTTSSNLSSSQTPVAKLLEGKGNAVFSVSPADQITHVVGLLKEKRIGALVVTDESGALKGILSERDIVRRMAENPDGVMGATVDALMTRDVVTCTPSDVLTDVLKRMTEGRFRHMPVVDNSTLCGVVTIGDVVNFRLKEVEYEALRMKQMIVG